VKSTAIAGDGGPTGLQQVLPNKHLLAGHKIVPLASNDILTLSDPKP
jgi:hypothetical protein